MAILEVKHLTRYRYLRPVSFGEHRLMCRPRDSHDLRMIDTRLVIKPLPAAIRWQHDPFSNSIARVRFSGTAAELSIESGFRAEHYPTTAPIIELEDFAQRYPFTYSSDDIPDLSRCVERHYPDPSRKVDRWARALLKNRTRRDTLELLGDMTQRIKAEHLYQARSTVGTQLPVETLELGSGTCRDFALLMIEAVRSLGLAARFVSGYLYDENLIGAGGGMIGGGATHAWVQVYLPGAGWVEFDPTNALIGGRNLIRVAVARDAAQAIPVSGSFFGTASDVVEAQISVEVTTG